MMLERWRDWWQGDDRVIDTLIRPPRVIYGTADWALISRLGARKWRATVEAQSRGRQRGPVVLRIAGRVQ